MGAKFFRLSLILSLVTFYLFSNATAATIDRFMELSEGVSVSWTADLDKEVIEFTVVANSLGYIGFGISPQGGMDNADIVIGGAFPDGSTYFSDRFATGKFEPAVDEKQDWTLLEAKENGTHTTLRFKRDFNTCDDKQDIVITRGDTTKFIWARGETDEIKHHGFSNKGAVAVNILDQAGPEFDTSDFDTWHIEVDTKMPSVDTSYWCTAHKTPERYNSRRQIVGFNVKLENAGSLEHNHHLILYQCRTSDPAVIAKFEEYIKTPGGECYVEGGPLQLFPHCNSFLYVWAKGGGALVLPEHVGIPLNEQGQTEYFLLEMHYDNPTLKNNTQYNTGVEVYTTTEKRKEDAGILFLGHGVSWHMMIPPDMEEYVISGHCGSACTERLVPEDGINVFSALLHSHLAGRKIKVRHFRGKNELPWLAYDNQYNFDFQQTRPLTEPLKILKGDHLTVECTDNSAYLNQSEAVLGGLSTRHEMCEAFLLYWPLTPSLATCISSYFDEPYFMKKFGIESFDPNSSVYDPTVSSPEPLKGKLYSEVLNKHVKWTPELKEELQNITRFSEHIAYCGGAGGSTSARIVAEDVQQLSSMPANEYVAYPKNFIPYEPKDDKCKGNDDSGSLHMIQWTAFNSILSLVSLATVVKALQF